MSGVSFEMDLASSMKLNKLLDHYTGSQGKAAMRKGCRWGAKIIHAAVKTNTPVKSGALIRSLKVRAMKRSRKGVGVMAKFGDGWYQGDTFYGAFLEFGHRVGKRISMIRKHKDSDTRGEVEGKFFMTKAAKAVKPIAKRAAIERMIYELEKTAPKNTNG